MRRANVDVVQLFLGFGAVNDESRMIYEALQGDPSSLLSAPSNRQLPE